jgi:hypothetical protein
MGTEKRKGMLTIVGAGIVLLGFVFRDGALEKAKEARSTQTSAKSVLVEASELVNMNGQNSVLSAEIIESQNLPVFETQFRLLPVKRQQLAELMFLLAAMLDRTENLQDTNERKQIEGLRDRGKDLERIYKTILIATDGQLNAVPKDKSELEQLTETMGHFETAWTSFSSDCKRDMRDVVRKAEDEQKSAETRVVRWTRANYVVWGLGWLIALISKLVGVEIIEQA